MKRLIALLLTLLTLSCTVVFAEEAIQPSADQVAEPYVGEQEFFIDVLLQFDQPDDTIIEFPIRIKAFSAAYRFDIIRDAETGQLSGFNYDPASFMTLSELIFEEGEKSNFNQFLLEHIDLTFSNIVLPEHFDLHQSTGSDYCWIAFNGSFDVTYNGTLFFNCYDGTLIDAIQKTVKYDYAFSNEDG